MPFSREEMDEMMRRWLAANEAAERTGDWATHLGAHYTDDAHYHYQLGPSERYDVRGVDLIKRTALGEQMEGFEKWRYPYQRWVVDTEKGEVVAFWKQRAPFQRPDGTPYEVAGVGGSRFVYAGDYKWREQEDFFDFSCTMALLTELAAAGLLEPGVRQKMHKVARGHRMAGHQPDPHRLGALEKLRGQLALARIALLGR